MTATTVTLSYTFYGSGSSATQGALARGQERSEEIFRSMSPTHTHATAISVLRLENFGKETGQETSCAPSATTAQRHHMP